MYVRYLSSLVYEFWFHSFNVVTSAV